MENHREWGYLSLDFKPWGTPSLTLTMDVLLVEWV